MADLRKLNPLDLEENPQRVADTINRIIDEIQRIVSLNDSVEKYVVLTHGVDLIVSAAELRNKLRNIEVLDYRPVIFTPVTDDLQDFEIINKSIQIENNQTAKCRFFWNNPETYTQMEIKMRLSS